uniref:DEP domain-containing protein n=1 Tax=Ganoderma boninense TaxID=34458 RepID=A0A5K1JYU4_9APHY|nr:DEP domain-containing protein [Ganoderma boninense]
MPRIDESDRYTDGCAEMITKWFSATGRVPRLLSVTYTIRGESHARLFAAQSRTLAPLVRDLEIVFKPDGTMQGALESVDLTLASYAALHSCTLRFALPEMCVAENTSLAWIPTIISQLSSASLGSLTISLVVDNVEDLRSLNSECAVRVLTTAYFDDLQDLDWVAMSQALSAGRLEGLRKVVFEGCGRRELLEEHIRNICPELHARGIVSLVAVAKEAAWAD